MEQSFLYDSCKLHSMMFLFADIYFDAYQGPIPVAAFIRYKDLNISFDYNARNRSILK